MVIVDLHACVAPLLWHLQVFACALVIVPMAPLLTAAHALPSPAAGISEHVWAAHQCVPVVCVQAGVSNLAK